MKRQMLWFCLIVLLPITATAQFTQVSATVTDPNGLAYANGTVVAKLVLPGGTSPTLNGLAYTPPSQPVGLNTNGFFLMQIADNNVLLPAATQWSFTVCSAAGTIQPAGGRGPVCFNAGPITITGASQSITATLNAAALALSLAGGIGGTLATGGNPGPIPYVSAANTLSEDASNFCWDATNHRMGIGTCAPGAGFFIDVEETSTPPVFALNGHNNGLGGVGGQFATTGGGNLTLQVANSTGTDFTNGIARAGFIMSGNPLQFGAGFSAFTHVIQTNGHEQINTTTDPGASIFLTVNGDLKNTHKIAGGTAPTISSGAGTGATIAGADESGTITVGTTPGNSIVVTLGQSYTNVPACSATDTSTTPVFVQCVGATGTLTLNGIAFSTGAAANFTATHVITWLVGGH